jgi:N-methylhydantoinase B/oxoprolinase/acetone carboxylase alpha subunit
MAARPASLSVVTVDPGGARERNLGGLVDGEPVRAGEIVQRGQTTGGGGWGDPLEREVELVCLDVLQGKITVDAARTDYGVVLKDGATATKLRQSPNGGACAMPGPAHYR